MGKKKLENLTADEFEQILDEFVDREPIEMPVTAFFQVLAFLDRQNQQDHGASIIEACSDRSSPIAAPANGIS